MPQVQYDKKKWRIQRPGGAIVEFWGPRDMDLESLGKAGQAQEELDQQKRDAKMRDTADKYLPQTNSTLGKLAGGFADFMNTPATPSSEEYFNRISAGTGNEQPAQGFVDQMGQALTGSMLDVVGPFTSPTGLLSMAVPGAGLIKSAAPTAKVAARALPRLFGAAAAPGAAMDINEAYQDPTTENVTRAMGSTGMAGLGLMTGKFPSVRGPGAPPIPPPTAPPGMGAPYQLSAGPQTGPVGPQLPANRLLGVGEPFQQPPQRPFNPGVAEGPYIPLQASSLEQGTIRPGPLPPGMGTPEITGMGVQGELPPDHPLAIHPRTAGIYENAAAQKSYGYDPTLYGQEAPVTFPRANIEPPAPIPFPQRLMEPLPPMPEPVGRTVNRPGEPVMGEEFAKERSSRDERLAPEVLEQARADAAAERAAQVAERVATPAPIETPPLAPEVEATPQPTPIPEVEPEPASAPVAEVPPVQATTRTVERTKPTPTVERGAGEPFQPRTFGRFTIEASGDPKLPYQVREGDTVTAKGLRAETLEASVKKRLQHEADNKAIEDKYRDVDEEEAPSDIPEGFQEEVIPPPTPEELEAMGVKPKRVVERPSKKKDKFPLMQKRPGEAGFARLVLRPGEGGFHSRIKAAIDKLPDRPLRKEDVLAFLRKHATEQELRESGVMSFNPPTAPTKFRGEGKSGYKKSASGMIVTRGNWTKEGLTRHVEEEGNLGFKAVELKETGAADTKKYQEAMSEYQLAKDRHTDLFDNSILAEAIRLDMEEGPANDPGSPFNRSHESAVKRINGRLLGIDLEDRPSFDNAVKDLTEIGIDQSIAMQYVQAAKMRNKHADIIQREYENTNIDTPLYGERNLALPGSEKGTYKETLVKAKKPAQQYEEPHWRQHGKNVAGHIRGATITDPETGMKIKRIDEVQAQWAQSRRDAQEHWKQFREGAREPEAGHGDWEAEAEMGIPKSPMGDVASSVRTLLQKAIYDAVESGHDAISWTTAEQQSKRYGKLIEEVQVVKAPSKVHDLPTDRINLSMGRERFGGSTHSLTKTQLLEQVGGNKKLADQIWNTKEGETVKLSEPLYQEGMEATYGQTPGKSAMIPDMVEKILGVKPEQKTLVSEAGPEWFAKIPEHVKEQLKREGVPAFGALQRETPKGTKSPQPKKVVGKPGERGSISTKPAEGPSEMQKVREDWARAALDAVAKLGPAGKELARLGTRARLVGEHYAGTWEERAMKAVEGISDEEFGAITKDRKVLRGNVIDVLEGNAAPRNAKIAEAANSIAQLFDEAGSRAEGSGASMRVGDKNVPFEKMNKYFPHLYTEEFWSRIKNDPKFKDNILQRMIKQDPKLTMDAASKLLQRSRKYGERLIDPQHERVFNLPGWERSKGAMIKHLHDMGRMIGNAEEVGPKDIAGTKLNDLIKKTTDPEYAYELMRRAMKREEPPTVRDTKVAGAITTAVAWGYLSRASIGNLGQLTRIPLHTSFKSTAKAFGQYIGDRGGLYERALGSGATVEIGAKGLMEEFGSKSRAYKWYGIEQSEKFLRSVASAAGRSEAEAAFRTLKKDPTNKTARTNLADLLQEDVDTVIKQNTLTEKQSAVAGGRAAELTQGRAEAMDLPKKWSSSPFMNLYFLYRKYAFQEQRNMVKAIKKSPVKAIATIAALDLAAGEAIGDVKELLKGLGIGLVKGDTAATIEKKIKERGQYISKDHPVAGRVLDNYLQRYTFGIWADTFQNLKRGELAGTVGSMAGDITEPVIKAGIRKVEGKPVSVKPLGKILTGKIPILGPGITEGLFPKDEPKRKGPPRRVLRSPRRPQPSP